MLYHPLSTQSLDATSEVDAELNTENKPILDPEIENKDEESDITTGSILVVDDNKNNTTLLTKRLKKIGNNVEVANDGIEALKIVEKGLQLDLILLDIIMPHMNGYEVLEYLKKDKRYHEIPVIMLSSMDDLTSIYRCIELGADDYVRKPFSQKLLIPPLVFSFPAQLSVFLFHLSPFVVFRRKPCLDYYFLKSVQYLWEVFDDQ